MGTKRRGQVMTAKYIEVMTNIQHRLDRGILHAGDKLPSVRQLAEELACSKNTIIKAYTELEKEHVIYSIAKSGYYVVTDVKQAKSSDNTIDFLSAGPDQTVLPYREFQHCLNQAIDQYKEELFTYSDPQGNVSLRKELVTYLQNLQVFTSPERLVIVSGSQQALNLFVSMPFPNGKKNILIEQPTYFGFIESAHLHGVQTFGIPLSMDGIDLEQLEYIFRNNDIKFFYIIPRFHNPLGHCYTNKEKKKIVELAEKYDVYLVEDDFLGDLDPDTKADPLFAFNPSGRVIYIKSFSKVFLPGLRVATVVLPPLMQHHFLRYKFSADFTSSALSQGALEIYLKSGMFETHLKKVQKLYDKKMKLLQTSFEEFLSSQVSFTTPTSGFYASVFLPQNVRAKRVVEKLVEHGVHMDDGARFYLPEYQHQNLLRLSISQVHEDDILRGVQKMAQCIQEIEKRKEQRIPNSIFRM